ncbi:LysR substrate binding domain protein [Neisseria sp. oral taxon 020 str. F0370]|uniref:LysR substrate-binding domain-containing protein n=1 Tax=unclassified Neisseria TaxID=2623750 RepID=UPI0002A3F938|nr:MULTISPECIES: LysR substrate-binding domain-containing protein [unclassified Neisseria]ASP17977.1 transcriptional regulator [Neisseria sp. KEM232]EKY05897.1 LysR substrate binding domain protein [Neisseria sp. oral taxon 020 str. F0370]
MNRIPFSLGALHAFEAAARLGSFKAAAAELALSPTAVSHRIRTLEAQLGKTLFERRTRAVVLTADGRLLAEAVSGSFAAIAEAASRIRRPERSRVILALTPEFARQWLVPRLAGFQAACPDVELHIRADYRTADLAAGEADLAVRYGGSDSAGIEAVPLFGETFAAAAAPALLSKLPAEPQNWPLLHLDWHKPQGAADWTAWAQAAGVPPHAMQGGTRYSDAGHLIQATLAGQGVALLGRSLLAEEFRLGLVHSVSDIVLPGRRYYLCRATGVVLSPAVRVVEGWLLAAGDAHDCGTLLP